MKWHQLSASLLAGLLCLATPLSAEDAVTAAAEREEHEANYKRMTSRIEQLEESLQAQQKRMGSLIQDIHTMREEVDRLKGRNENAATQEWVKRLAEQIEEVDKKRKADNELVLTQLKAIGKGISKSITPRDPAPPGPAPTAKPEKQVTPPGGPAPEKAYAYQIKSGDTLQRIVTELRAQGYKITQKQVMETNPGVNWNRLKIGQTVFIPPPSP